jgi:hypothetical protein
MIKLKKYISSKISHPKNNQKSQDFFSYTPVEVLVSYETTFRGDNGGSNHNIFTTLRIWQPYPRHDVYK